MTASAATAAWQPSTTMSATTVDDDGEYDDEHGYDIDHDDGDDDKDAEGTKMTATMTGMMKWRRR